MKHKFLTVCIEGEKSPSIQISGTELEKSGFCVGDMVRVYFEKNEIRIKKDDSTEAITEMTKRNPALLSLVKNLGLEVA